MAEIGHALDNTYVSSTQNGATYGSFGAVGQHDIEGSELDGNSDYLLIAKSIHCGDITSSSEFYMNMEEQGVGDLAESESRIEPRRGTATFGHFYGFMDRVTTAATPNTYRLRGHSDGVVNCRANGTQMLMLKLDDLSASNFKWAASDADDTSLTDVIENGQSVTLDSDGDWLIVAFARYKMNSTATDAILQIDVGGTTHGRIQFEGEDVEELRCYLTSTVATRSGSDITVTLQYGLVAGTSADLLSNRIFALRLDAFEDHAFARSTTSTAITNFDTVFNVHTLSHVSATAASRNWFVWGQVVYDNNNNQAKLKMAIDQGGSTILGGAANSNTQANPVVAQHGATDEHPLVVFGQEASHPNATDLDLDILVNDDDSPGNGAIDEKLLVAFTWELAAATDSASISEQVDLTVTFDASVTAVRGFSNPIDLLAQQTAVAVGQASVAGDATLEGTFISLAAAAGAISSSLDAGETWAAAAAAIADTSEAIDLKSSFDAIVSVVSVSLAENVDLQESLAGGLRTSGLVDGTVEFAAAMERLIADIAAAIQILVAKRERRLVVDPKERVVFVPSKHIRIVAKAADPQLVVEIEKGNINVNEIH